MDWEGESIMLLKPLQYMNRSGGAVASLASFHRIEPSRILVAHDELDFGAGTVRLKIGGGHGGHNGLRDIVARLGSGDFSRIRLGIGRPENREEVTNYVLGTPSRQDKELLLKAIDQVLNFLPKLLSGRITEAMNELHA